MSLVLLTTSLNLKLKQLSKKLDMVVLINRQIYYKNLDHFLTQDNMNKSLLSAQHLARSLQTQEFLKLEK
jgi:hypothetical protein